MPLIHYRPKHMPHLLGVSRSTYYKLVEQGHLPYSRMYQGGPRVHLPEHIEQYKAHLRRNANNSDMVAARSSVQNISVAFS